MALDDLYWSPALIYIDDVQEYVTIVSNRRTTR
uniref:Uncharacterized protein n=1 Tax=Arundo donax TaxID=35708 RepID=A0A0A8YQQ7_ARUDO